MGRSKMEREFSEKLSRREITPSAQSWDKLDAMLSASEKQKQKPKMWYFIAASILAFAFASVFLFETQPKQQIDVVTQSKSDTAIENPATQELSLPAKVFSNSKIAASGKQVRQKSAKNFKSSINQQQLAQNVSDSNPNRDLVQSIAAVHAKVSDDRSNDEAFKLLSEVKSTEKTPNSIRVNSKNLLSQVEEPDGLTFRQKLFRSVGKNYQNVKVALANRNMEDENQ